MKETTNNCVCVCVCVCWGEHESRESKSNHSYSSALLYYILCKYACTDARYEGYLENRLVFEIGYRDDSFLDRSERCSAFSFVKISEIQWASDLKKTHELFIHRIVACYSPKPTSITEKIVRVTPSYSPRRQLHSSSTLKFYDGCISFIPRTCSAMKITARYRGIY